ncbi:lytic transglycosylase domain-containing protein [Nocardioides sp. AX2bis]|uniref:aggregation-promoting factor C-terminal-like domain-containing protein n=1 Tax=Nocardioides sp. AX2bis TaxID=2653157 RepID=UPI0012F0929D|nr:lytic transglycosylase domain-containing protein [Nocardioides sp. AX2bis]VXC02663.1 conserved hypothetical protein [Nocardioides sp. AX2bis]
MSKHVKHVPKHRSAPVRPALEVPRRAVRTTLVLSSVAVAVTGVTVGAGVLGGQGAVLETAGASVAGTVPTGTAGTAGSQEQVVEAAEPAAEEAAELGEREPVVSRSDRRAEADPAKEEALAVEVAPAMTASETLSDDDPREIAQTLLPEFGFSSDQFSCLDSLWTKESGWDPSADNPTSSAYGIPQSLPGEKMASAGADWATNPATQIRWGLGYIQDVYGSPCSAWAHSQAVNWY